jgi:hypothetical protein
MMLNPSVPKPNSNMVRFHNGVEMLRGVALLARPRERVLPKRATPWPRELLATMKLAVETCEPGPGRSGPCAPSRARASLRRLRQSGQEDLLPTHVAGPLGGPSRVVSEGVTGDDDPPEDGPDGRPVSVDVLTNLHSGILIKDPLQSQGKVMLPRRVRSTKSIARVMPSRCSPPGRSHRRGAQTIPYSTKSLATTCHSGTIRAASARASRYSIRRTGRGLAQTDRCSILLGHQDLKHCLRLIPTILRRTATSDLLPDGVTSMGCQEPRPSLQERRTPCTAAPYGSLRVKIVVHVDIVV